MSNRRVQLESLNHTPKQEKLPDFVVSTILSQHFSDFLHQDVVENKKAALDNAINQLDQLPPTETPGLRAFLRFCLSDILSLPNPADQKSLLFWHLSSMQSEYARLPITSVGYTIDTKDDELRLLDRRYTHQPDVFTISTRETGQPLLDRRYRKEALQIKTLLSWLTTQLNAVDKLANPTKALLEQGWKPTNTILTYEAAAKLGIEKNTPMVAGPKTLYCMPSTTVHEGGMSVLVLAQPAFIPSTQTLVLLHDQQMLKLETIDCLRIFANHGSHVASKTLQQLSNKQAFSDDELETVAMQELLQLPPETITESAAKTFSQLLQTHSFFSRFAQIIKMRKLNRAESSLQNIAKYLLNTIQEELADLSPTAEQLAFLETHIKNVVLPTVFGHEHISKMKLIKMQQTHMALRKLPLAEFLEGMGSLLPSMQMKFDLRGLDCLVGLASPLSSSFSNTELLSVLKTGNVSKKQVVKMVGKERAENWTEGVCGQAKKCVQKDLFGVDPRQHITWIGECSVCFFCEEAMSAQPAKSINQNISPETIVPKKTPPKKLAPPPAEIRLPPITLTNFLASVI